MFGLHIHLLLLYYLLTELPPQLSTRINTPRTHHAHSTHTHRTHTGTIELASSLSKVPYSVVGIALASSAMTTTL